MSSINSDEIISILKEEIENFDTLSKDSEVGTVVAVGDGIATIYGIDHAMYGEIVTFETGLKGMVQDIRKNEIGCILFGSDTGIREGTKVARTGKKAGVPVGDAYVGADHWRPSDGKDIHCFGHNSESERQRCNLCLCCNRTESIDSCQSCKYIADAWSDGLYDYRIFHSKRLCPTSVHCTICRNSNG